MRVISKARLKQFWELPGHEDAEGPLRAWYTHISSRTVSWQSWGDVKASFASASIVRRLHRIQYRWQQVPVDWPHPLRDPEGLRPEGDGSRRIRRRQVEGRMRVF